MCAWWSSLWRASRCSCSRARSSITPNSPQLLPGLRATLLDAEKRSLFDWTFAVDQDVVGPGEIVRFRTEAINPPEAFERSQITFVRSGLE